MKKELLGYTVVFMKKEEAPIMLSIEEGNNLMSALADNMGFIKIKSRNMMIRSNTIDRVVGQYKKLEEVCLFCHKLKPINSRCPQGCDEPHKENRRAINKMKEAIGKPMPKVEEAEREYYISRNCKACYVMIESGEYCKDCKGLYD